MQQAFHSHERLVTPTPSAYEYPLLVKQLLINALALNAHQEITYRGETRYSYADLRRRIGQLASMLESFGVQAGATVAVMDWDSHRYLECYFAVPMMGAVLCTVNVRTSPNQIKYALNDSNTQLLIANAEFLPFLEQIYAGLTNPPLLIIAQDDGGAALPATHLPLAGVYELCLTAAAPDFVFRDFDERTCAALFYTTGTTGDPKGVSYSHRQIVLHTLTVATTLSSARDEQCLHRDDVYMPITPMFHVLAWGIPYVAVMLGLKIVLPGRYSADVLLRLRRTEGVTFSHCVPTLLQMLLDGAARDDQDLSGWKLMIGGSVLSPSLCRAALAKGVDVFSGYGMSETGPMVTLSQFPPTALPMETDERVRKLCMAGRPVPLVELRVVDSDMRDVPQDGEARGEIILRAPFLTLGYYGQRDASEVLWKGGYLHTQDIAVIHPDGYLQIVDRIKDVIKTGGEWISSVEIEVYINEIPDVLESAVIGVKDEKWGERPVALVVCAAGSALTPLDVREYLLTLASANRISRYAVPESTRIVFVDEIPKTGVGKLDKKRLRKWID